MHPLLALLALLPAPTADVSTSVQAQLNANHLVQLSSMGSVVTMHDVVVPAGGKIDGSGVTIHVPVTAKFGVQLAGIGAKAQDLTMVCDTGNILTNGKVDPKLFPAAGLPIGIDCASGGVKIDGCSLSWFGVAVHSAAPEVTPGGETMIDELQVINPVLIGVDMEGASTDNFLSRCVVSRTVSGVGDGQLSEAGNGLQGIKWASSAGYVTDCHVWGAFNIGAEFDGPDTKVTGLTSEGGRQVLILLNNWRIQLDAFVYFPEGPANALAVAIQAGTKPQGCHLCDVHCRFGGLGNYNYQSILSHVNDGQGNDYHFRFDRASGWPTITYGPNDTHEQYAPTS